nr:Gag-Pol polyprotein [Tanacetum cinerariifolium]
MPDTANISDSKDTDSAHLLKIKQRPEWLKPIPNDERPATPEPTWVIPTSYIPDAVNKWAKALATTYQSPLENSLLEKTGDMRTFMHCKGSRQALSISKMKAARYLDFGLELLEFYIDRNIANSSRKVVRTHMRILGVVSIKAYSRYGNFEDLNLLLLQGHLNHLSGSYKRMLSTVVKLWTRWNAKGFEYKHDYTIIDSPRTVVFPVGNNERKIMRFNEIYKFNDGTLTNIMESLDYKVKEYKNIRVIPKYHNEDGNPARANIKQALGSLTLSMCHKNTFSSDTSIDFEINFLLQSNVHGKNSCGKNQKAKVSVKEFQKKYQPKVAKPKTVGTRESLATPKPRKPRLLLRWSPTGRLFDQEGQIVDSSELKSKSDCSNGDNGCTSNTMEPKIKSFQIQPLCLTGYSDLFMVRRFRNDHVADILGFGNLQWGNILITRVYFVKGLGHNLLSEIVQQTFIQSIFMKWPLHRQSVSWLELLPPSHGYGINEAAKFVGNFKSLANEADASLAKHKALELEIERLLKVVVSQDILSVVQNASVVDTSVLQTELERTKERFENCIIKKETEYAKLWNDWYKKCNECKYDKIPYDIAYKDMQQKIERLQAHLGDLK